MNLKKIIREEIDDMDWIKDIDTPQVGDTYKFIMSGQFNGQYKSNPWNIVITDIKEHPSRQVGYSVITLHYRLQSTTVKYMPTLKDYEIYLDEFLTGVEEGRFVKIKEINESDDLQWIRDVRPIKYNMGDVIEPINGYFYYTKPWSEKYGPISGHVNAKIIDIVDGFYEIVLNYDIYEDILEAPTYYISIYDTDNKNLNESDEMDWIREIPAGFELKQNQRYIIDCCETGYNEDIFLNKFIELFGDIPPYNKYLNIVGTSPPSLLVNWFNNGYIKEQNHRVNLLLKMPGMPRHSEIGGWLRCGEEMKSHKITPQDFLNGVIDWDSDI